jgi:hypothetical protein
MKKLLLLGIILIYLALVLVFGIQWKKLGVPANGGFNDLKATLEFVEIVHDKGNPYVKSHYVFPFVYPKIWSVLYPVFQVKNCRTIGLILSILYFATIFFFIKISNYLDLFIYSMIIISPSFMLGIERGNVDIMLFSILGLSLLFYKKDSILSIFILLSSFFKIFPIYAIIALKSHFKIIVSVLVFILYLFIIKDQITCITHNLTFIKPYILAYGVCVLPDYLHISYKVPLLFTYLFELILAIFLIFIIKPIKLGESKDDVAFLIGAGIFVGTYIFNSNFVYKMIFILFSIPKLLEYGKLDKKNYLIVFLIIASLWEFFIVGILTRISPISGIGYRILNQIILIYIFTFFINTIYFKFAGDLKKYLLILRDFKFKKVYGS